MSFWLCGCSHFLLIWANRSQTSWRDLYAFFLQRVAVDVPLANAAANIRTFLRLFASFVFLFVGYFVVVFFFF